jgi:hypothetical protein
MLRAPILGGFAGPILCALVLVIPTGGVATAQERPGPAVEFAAGWVGFADDGIVSEGLVGGAARMYLSSRIAVGPEVVYIDGSNHSHLVVTGNLTWDVLASIGGAPRITPFVVVGGGLYQTRETFFSGPFTSSEGAFTAGGGVRARASDRVTVGIDARLGWETHIRINGIVGVRIGR